MYLKLEAPKRRKKKKEPIMDTVLPEFTIDQRVSYTVYRSVCG